MVVTVTQLVACVVSPHGKWLCVQSDN